MTNYLARLKVIVSETRLPSELPKGPKAPSGPFGSGQGGHVLKFEAATGDPGESLPRVPEPPASVASLDERRAAVEALRDAMQAENESRRDWWSEPVAGRPDGRPNGVAS